MDPHSSPPPSNPWIFRQPPSLSFAFFFSLSLLSLPVSTADSPYTIYDHLRLYGLPIGLLPKGITDFSINTTSGQFQVFLDQPCNAKFENEVHYDFNVTGTLSSGRIGELSGVEAQELFLWFPVKGIRVDVPNSGLIHFDVGVVDKQFSLSLFDSPPDCAAVDPLDSDVAGEDADGSQSGSQGQSIMFEREINQGDVLRAV
ncbi:Protein of unknown function, DUF538 [Quillaja saponaria]|uniref:Uncharacterized protein n=1 Tax=Quillaja saponaria TaxID=32244 RepID=A0AAD7VJM9_QUISA|nr:Protein of unknown function, DUF538 [Quillaja saponaria]